MKNTPNSTKYASMVADITAVAASLDIIPAQMNQATYLGLGRYTANELSTAGGYRAIVKDQFPATDKMLDVIVAQKDRMAYVRKLEKAKGRKDYFVEQLRAEMLSMGENLKPAKMSVKFKKPTGMLRANVAFLSDSHFGLRVSRKEVKYNEFNWQIAARRLARFTVEVANYKLEHRDDCPALHLILGGDIIHGLIHDDSEHCELVTYQVAGAQAMLKDSIEYLRKHYSKIIVETCVGNHDRILKGDGGRAMSQRFDSYGTQVYLGLAAAYTNIPQVKFNITENPISSFEILGHRYMLTHGDAVLRAGSVGKNVNVARIAEHVNRFMVEAVTHGEKKYDAVLMGHTHVPMSTTLSNNVELILNGTLSGLDAYARSLGITATNPSQTIFEATEDYAVGDIRKIYLHTADQEAALDQVVKTYECDLSKRL